MISTNHDHRDRNDVPRADDSVRAATTISSIQYAKRLLRLRQAILAGVNHAERMVPRRIPSCCRRASVLEAELAAIESKLDSSEPLAHPGRMSGLVPWSTPAQCRIVLRPFPRRWSGSRSWRQTIRSSPAWTKSKSIQRRRQVARRPVTSPRPVQGGSRARRPRPGAAIHKIAHLNDGQTGNSHSWISKVPGKGSITLTWPKPVTIDRVVWGRDRDEVYRDRLPTEYYIEAALEPTRWQVVASSLDRVPYGAQAEPATAVAPNAPSLAGLPTPHEPGATVSASERAFNRQSEIRARRPSSARR